MSFGAIVPEQLQNTTNMKRDQQIMQRRDKAIFARFNQLLPTGKMYQRIYEQIGEEFYLSDERVKKIVLKMSLARDKKSFQNKGS